MSDDEIRHVAIFVSLTEDQLIQRFTRLTRDRRGLLLIEKASGECQFLEGGNCSVQSVKLQQCRDFPNLWRFSGFEKTCHAKPRPVEAEQYFTLVTQATGRSEEYVRAHPSAR